MAIIDFEQPEGVIASLGGQTAINLAQPLMDRGVKIIGTDCAAIERAENRDSFEKILLELNIPQPNGAAVTNIEDGVRAAAEIGYPVLVRPSFFAYCRMIPLTLLLMEKAGYTEMESPLWIPVRSTSSMMPGTNTFRPSQMASTSTSLPWMYLSISTGLSASISTAVFR